MEFLLKEVNKKGNKAFRQLFIIIVLLFLCAYDIFAWNPFFTPIDLVNQSSLIVSFTFEERTDKNQIKVKIIKVLKGNIKDSELIFNLKTAGKSAAKSIERFILRKKAVLFFSGKFYRKGYTDLFFHVEREKILHNGLMSIDGHWVTFNKSSSSAWNMHGFDNLLYSTWDGGTDMLHNFVESYLKGITKDCPTSCNARNWEKLIKLSEIKGIVNEIEPVFLKGKKKYIYICCSKGDRIYALDPEKSLFEVTNNLGLKSKSLRSIWVDLNKDNKLDLLSWNGKVLAVYHQDTEGRFTLSDIISSEEIKHCLGISAITFKNDKHKAPVLLVSTEDQPMIFRKKADGMYHAAGMIINKNINYNKLGSPGECIIADFNGDSVLDVIQPCRNNSLFYKGKPEGTFAAPIIIGIKKGKGRTDFCTGDFDADGMPDIFSVSEDYSRLWHNYGGLKFVDSFGHSGELKYLSRPGGFQCKTCDINNDNRDDLLIIYSGKARTPPQIFFNRGFRSFLYCHRFDITQLSENPIPGIFSGQQAVCITDLNNDGGQDMIIVLNNGEIWLCLT